MEILLARDMGFCWGVRRAIDIMEKAADEKGAIISLGPIVHNPQVVRELEGRGVRTAGDLADGDSLPVAITAHGVGPEVLEDARSRGNEVIDTTCPIVTRSQQWARRLGEEGFAIVIFGDPAHKEVRGVVGWSTGKVLVIPREDQVGPLPPEFPSRIGVLSQTTETEARFADFVKKLLEANMDRISELRIINTLCHATTAQQAATMHLAQEVDLMIVVGGRDSANTRHLADVSRQAGVATYHVEAADQIERAWLDGHDKVGVTAGASTPDFAIAAVVERLQALAPAPATP